ncbi:hypothetical protein GEMRC1_006586 [Eukaryota sp. GEM-RC1]
MGLPFLPTFLEQFVPHSVFELSKDGDTRHTKIAIDCRYFLRVFIPTFFRDRTKGIDLSHALYLFNQFFLGLKRRNISCAVFDGVSQRDNTNPVNDRSPPERKQAPFKSLRYIPTYTSFFAVHAGHELRVYSGRYDSFMMNSVVSGECSFCICRPVLIPHFSFAVLPNEAWNEVVHLFVSGFSSEPVFFEIYHTDDVYSHTSRSFEEIWMIDGVHYCGKGAVRAVFGGKWKYELLEHLLKCPKQMFSRYIDNIDKYPELREFVKSFVQQFVTSSCPNDSLSSKSSLHIQSDAVCSVNTSFYQSSSPTMNLRSRAFVDSVSQQSFTVVSFQRPLIEGIDAIFTMVTDKPNCSQFELIKSNATTAVEFIDSCAFADSHSELAMLPIFEKIAELQPIAFTFLLSLRFIRSRQKFLNLPLFSDSELILLLFSSFTDPRQLPRVVSTELSYFQVQVAGSTLHRVVELLTLLGFFFIVESIHGIKFKIVLHIEYEFQRIHEYFHLSKLY